MTMTVAEIGRLAGCSSATVSRALNNSGSVSAKTRTAVLKAVREAQAAKRVTRRLGTGRQNSRLATDRGFVEIIYHRATTFERVDRVNGGIDVGPMTEQADAEQLHEPAYQLEHSFYRRIVDAAVAETGFWGRRAVLQHCRDLVDPDFLKELSHPDRCGVLLVGLPSDSLEQFTARCPHPLVLVDIVYDGWPDVVTSDNVPGIEQAFEYLYQLGHRRIGFGGRCDMNFAHRERFLGYKLKMVEANLPIRNEWIYEGMSQIGQAVEGFKAILSKPDRPTAILCANDWVAIGALNAAISLGLQVPRDLSIVGFDDTESSLLTSPALTSVRVRVDEIGRQAVRQLMIQLQAGVSERSAGTRIRVPTQLIIRGSAGPV